MPEWMKKTQKSTICCLQKKSFQLCKTYIVKSEETEKDIMQMVNKREQNYLGISVKTDFQSKLVKREKEGKIK